MGAGELGAARALAARPVDEAPRGAPADRAGVAPRIATPGAPGGGEGELIARRAARRRAQRQKRAASAQRDAGDGAARLAR